MKAMARIVHIALKVEDLDKATKFYEDVFGIYQLKTGHARGHTSRHMTEGTIDLALMTYDSEDEPEAQLSGPGPCIHHFGIEVEDREATAKKIAEHGGEIFSDPGEGALKFRAPDGNMCEIVNVGRYKLRERSPKAKIVHLALKVMDLEKATKFYEDVFGFRNLGDGYSRGHISRHMTDGNIDLALMKYDSEDEEEATWAGAGPRIHHFGIEVHNQDAFAEEIKKRGGRILSKPGSGALKFRSPDGTLAEVTKMGRYESIKGKGVKSVSPD
jgi:lactoylglutathione lyase